MSRLLLRLDGQNLCQTVLDTGELSVLRGGGLALLYAPRQLFKHLAELGHTVEVVYYGSSEGVAYVTPADKSEVTAAFQELVETQAREFLAGSVSSADPMTEALLPILPFLTISLASVVTADDGKFEDDHQRLINQNRHNQMQALTVDCLPARPEDQKNDPKLARPCQIDRTRPIAGKFQKGSDVYQVSESVLIRQRYGKKLRQGFYGQELAIQEADEKDSKAGLEPWPENDRIRQSLLKGENDYRFSNHFDEIAHPPEGKADQIPEKLQGKMAVLYADGNGFGAIKKELCHQAKDYADFSEHVQRQRRRLLFKVVEIASQHRFKNTDRDGVTREVIPMETLLWGGDELTLVVPAWAALEVLEGIAPLLDERWTWRKHHLTQAWGLVLCHHKTPIREARRLSEELAESAKDLRDIHDKKIGRQRNYWQYMVLMGMDPPPQGVGHFRKKHYQCDNARPFTLDLAKIGDTLTILRKFQGLPPKNDTATVSQGVPPSQLHKFRALAMEGGLLGKDADSEEFRRWRDKVDAKLENYTISKNEKFSWHKLATPALAYNPDHPLMPLMPLFHLLHLSEYVDPLDRKGGGA